LAPTRAGVGRDRLQNNDQRRRLQRRLPELDLSADRRARFGGGQIGYNWQTGSMFGPLVYGVEADIQGSEHARRYVAEQQPFRGSAQTTAYRSAPRLVRHSSWSRRSAQRWSGAELCDRRLCLWQRQDHAQPGLGFRHHRLTQPHAGHGWTYGGGVEASLSGNWTAKIEALYLNLGNKTDRVRWCSARRRPSTPLIRARNLFRVGLNYRIGGNNSTYVPAPAANWTGWYLGGNVGSGIGRDRTSVSKAGDGLGDLPSYDAFNLAPDGINGGVQLGYNWQMANWVYGLETDIQASSQRDNKTAIGLGDVPFDAKLPWFGTVRGRLGYSVGSTLFYATGGYAYGGVKTKASEDGVVQLNASTTRSGWTAAPASRRRSPCSACSDRTGPRRANISMSIWDRPRT
jgi:outer membrane immunogenic protein